MSFFDSPIGRCEAVHEMVLLDETQRECAREHGCPPDRVCPLEAYFEDESTRAPAPGTIDHPRSATTTPV